MGVTDGISTQYKHYCEQLGIKANSQVLQQLPNDSGAASFVDWDLGGNCVGTKGAAAVLKLVQNNFVNLRRISFRGNNLASAATQDVYNALVRHPSITSIDLSNNDIRLGGPALVDLVKRNKKIVELNIDQTFLRPLFERLIALHLKRNREAASGGAAAVTVAAPPASKAGAAAAAAAKPATTTATDDEQPFAIGRAGRRAGGGPAAVAAVAVAADDEQKAQRSPRRAMFAEESAGTSAAASKQPVAASEPSDDDQPFGGGDAGEGFAFGEPPADGDAGDPDDIDDTLHVSFSNATGGKKVARRATVSSEAYSADEIENYVPPKNDHDPEVREWLFKTLEKHDFFSHLEDFELYVAVDAMEQYQRGKGDHLYEEAGGEDEETEVCDSFFLIHKGSLQITKGGKVVRVANAGESVMDTMLLHPGQATETATVMQDDAEFYTLDRKTYRCVLTKASKKKRAMYEGFLSSIGFLKGLQKQELLSLADSLKPAQYAKGEKLITYGTTGEHFFIIVEGTVDVFGRDDAGKSKWVCDFKEGACVGELEFIHNHKCVADVVAKTDVRTAKMNRRHFEMVMGPIKDVLARTAAESEVYEYYRNTQKKREAEGH